MTERALVIRQIATDVGPELERLIDDWLSSDMLPGSMEKRSLELYLWDNKVGFMRVLNHTRAHGT